MKICLEEIRRCQKTKLKPNFIVLLGDRYGWRPAPPETPQVEFEEIENRLSQEDIDMLRKWYLLDSNAVPAVYCLQPRTGEYRNPTSWETVEAQLRSILLKAIATMDMSEKEIAKYFESATEQEISQGLSNLEAQKHVFCFLRKIKSIKENPKKDFVDLDKTGKIDTESNNRLNTLKDRLHASLPNNCFEYETSLANNGITQDHINQFCIDAGTSLAGIIQEEIKHFSEIDTLDKEVEDHAVFGDERARFLLVERRLFEESKIVLDVIANCLWLFLESRAQEKQR
jgi:hypothetical protein